MTIMCFLLIVVLVTSRTLWEFAKAAALIVLIAYLAGVVHA